MHSLDPLAATYSYLALLWGLLFILHKAADHNCRIVGPLGQNAEIRQAQAFYDRTRLALITLSVCAAVCLILGPLALRV